MPRNYPSIPRPGEDSPPIYYRILKDCGESLSAEDQAVTRTYDVLWNERIEFHRLLLGWSQYGLSPLGSGTRYLLKRFLPHSLPEFPRLYADRVELVGGIGIEDSDDNGLFFGRRDHITPEEGDADVDAWLEGEYDPEEVDGPPLVGFGDYPPDASTPPSKRYGFARYRVTYTPREYELVDDDTLLESVGDEAGVELARFVKRDLESGIENLIVPAVSGGLKFVDGSPNGTPINQNPAITVPLQTVKYIWHQVPAVNHAIIENYLGKVNIYAFDGIPGGDSYLFASEELLFLSCRTTRKTDITGFPTWRIEYTFGRRPKSGWNKFIGKNLRFVYVNTEVTNGVETGHRVYRATFDHVDGSEVDVDFKNLFIPGNPLLDPFTRPGGF